MLHLLNGDSVLHSMGSAGLPGEARVWGDVLWEGPLLRDASRAEERRARAEYFAGTPGEVGQLLAMSERWDAALESALSHDQVVLWFEHDLHDQFELIHHLAWFARQPHPGLSLICIGEFPGVVPFHGLGQLSGPQLATLFPTREPVTPAQLQLGARAWEALTSPDPLELEQVWRGETSPLPYLGGALQRFFEEFPAVGSGLSRTEKMVLEELKTGPASPRQLFSRLQQTEERVFMGDLSFWRIVERLGGGPNHLLQLGAGTGQARLEAPAAITESGRAVLAGRADRIALLGIDRWLGGVHLQGNRLRWRWNPATRRIRKDS